MNKIKKVIILGAGGTSLDILDVIKEISQEEGFECIGFLDDKESAGKIINKVKVLGGLKLAKDFKDTFFINGIGSPANFFKKEEIIKKTSIPLHRFITIIHPSSGISRTALIGIGSVIFQNVTINSNVKIGNHIVVLPNSVISHNDSIGDYSCIASSASISGDVEIGKSCYIGANSSIKESIKVGNHSLIGMGSVVLENIPSNSVYVGNPAQFLRKLKT